MKRWITTRQAWFWFGSEVEDRLDPNRKFANGVRDVHFYRPDLKQMGEAVAAFLRRADLWQMEVKAVIPLQGATAETYAHNDLDHHVSTLNHASYGYGWGWGLGHGYGAAYTGGVLVILQGEEMIDAAEYDARVEAAQAEIARREAAEDLREELTASDAALERLQAAQAEAFAEAERAGGIKTHKPMLGAAQYICDKNAFASLAEAEAYRDGKRQALERAETALAQGQERRKAQQERLRELTATAPD